MRWLSSLIASGLALVVACDVGDCVLRDQVAYPSPSGQLLAVVNVRACPLDRPRRQVSIVPADATQFPNLGNAYRANDDVFVHPVWRTDSALVLETANVESGWVHRGRVGGTTVKVRDLGLAALDSLSVAPRRYTVEHLAIAVSRVRQHYMGSDSTFSFASLKSVESGEDPNYVSVVTLDAWRQIPRITIFGDSIRATSAGADSTFDTADDIEAVEVRCTLWSAR